MEETTLTPTSEVTETQDESQSTHNESTNVVNAATSEEVNTDEANADKALADELAKLKESQPKLQPHRTEEEKARFTIAKILERHPNIKDEIYTPPVEEDEAPLTRSEMLKMIAELKDTQAVKSATELADTITNPVEREMVKYHIENTIKPTGNAQQDLNTAKLLVNARKQEIAREEQARRGVTKIAPSARSAPSKADDTSAITLTPDEEKFVRAGALTREEIIKMRTVDPTKVNFVR